MKQYIGNKIITSVEKTNEKTEGGVDILKVSFRNGAVEHFSRLMFDKIVSEKSCDEATLREKRVAPVVAILLSILREWGIKAGELQYLSALLNRSLDYNRNQALTKLLSDWMPKPKSLDDLDLITIDRILKSNGNQKHPK
jgi:hypothetical protein